MTFIFLYLIYNTYPKIYYLLFLVFFIRALPSCYAIHPEFFSPGIDIYLTNIETFAIIKLLEELIRDVYVRRYGWQSVSSFFYKKQGSWQTTLFLTISSLFCHGRYLGYYSKVIIRSNAILAHKMSLYVPPFLKESPNNRCVCII